MKRTFNIIKSAIAVILAACILTGCSSPLISDKVMDTMVGAYRYIGDLITQIKEEGWGSISALFGGSDEEESSSSAPSENSDADDSSKEDSSQQSE